MEFLLKVNVQLRISQLQSLATTRILGFDRSGEVQCPGSWSWTREKYCSVNRSRCFVSNQDSILKPGNEVGICCSNKNQFVHAVQIPEHDSRFATQNGFKRKSTHEFIVNSALNDFHCSSDDLSTFPNSRWTERISRSELKSIENEPVDWVILIWMILNWTLT